MRYSNAVSQLLATLHSLHEFRHGRDPVHYSQVVQAMGIIHSTAHLFKSKEEREAFEHAGRAYHTYVMTEMYPKTSPEAIEEILREHAPILFYDAGEPDKPQGKVYSFFTKAPMEPGKNAQDYIAEHKGQYIGVLPKGTAGYVHDLIRDLEEQKERIEAKMRDYEHNLGVYGSILSASLAAISEDSVFDPARHEVYVDEDGHCWAVEK